MTYLIIALILSGMPPSHLLKRWKDKSVQNSCGLYLFYANRLKKFSYKFSENELNSIKTCKSKLFPPKFNPILKHTSYFNLSYPKNYIKTPKLVSRIPSGTWWFGYIPYLLPWSKYLKSQAKDKTIVIKQGKWVHSQGFVITVNKISQKEYSKRKLGFSGSPKVNISFDSARNFCKKLGGDLPTEIQWEIAARGGDYYRPFTWGESIPIACYQLSGAKCGKRKRILDVTLWGVRNMSTFGAEWVLPSKLQKINKGYAIIKGGGEKSSWFFNLIASFQTVKSSRKSGQIGFRCVFPLTFKKKISKSGS